MLDKDLKKEMKKKLKLADNILMRVRAHTHTCTRTHTHVCTQHTHARARERAQSIHPLSSTIYLSGCYTHKQPSYPSSNSQNHHIHADMNKQNKNIKCNINYVK